MTQQQFEVKNNQEAFQVFPLVKRFVQCTVCTQIKCLSDDLSTDF